MGTYERVYIAEKSSVGRSLTKCKKIKQSKSGNGFIEIVDIDGKKSVITWCSGHLLEAELPSVAWNEGNLPIFPNALSFKPIDRTKNQLEIVISLIKASKNIVNVGDPDREGQLLVDMVIKRANKDPFDKNTFRMFVQSTDEANVTRGFSSIVPNSEQEGLYNAGVSRSYFDWIFGMNLTRAATIFSHKQGCGKTLVMGRVQLAILGIVVMREREINDFKPQKTYNIKAVFGDKEKSVKTDWVFKGSSIEEVEKLKKINSGSDDDDTEDLDSNDGELPSYLNRSMSIIDKAVADEKVSNIKAAKKGVVILDKRENDTIPFLKGLTLSSLQKELNLNLGVDLETSTKILSELYLEGYMTYPRSDCEFIPNTQHANSSNTLNNILKIDEFKEFSNLVDKNAKTKIWREWGVDKEVKDSPPHHAIIPTSQLASSSLINSGVKYEVYLFLCRHYLSHFLPAPEVKRSKIKIEIAKEVFEATGRVVLKNGWLDLFPEKSKSTGELPLLVEGQDVNLVEVSVKEGETQPKPRFTESGMPSLLSNIYKLTSDLEDRKVLKQSSGIGTEATRSVIINELKKKGYLENVGKHLVPTALGCAIFDITPEQLYALKVTSKMETDINLLSKNKKEVADVRREQLSYIEGMIAAFRAINYDPVVKLFPKSSGNADTKTGNASIKNRTVVGKCPVCEKEGRDGVLLERNGKYGKFVSCSNYPVCSHKHNK